MICNIDHILRDVRPSNARGAAAVATEARLARAKQSVKPNVVANPGVSTKGGREVVICLDRSHMMPDIS